VVVSGKELFGQEKKTRRHKSAKGKKISVFTDLNVGDYVVHYVHGIGKYIGIEQLVVENVKKIISKFSTVTEIIFMFPQTSLT